MDDVWLMIRIFLIVLAWGGLLLFAGYALEMGSRAFGRNKAAGEADAGATGPGAARDSA
ncbi:MAG: hypothetical protein M3389_04865 [Actinomycetota bacterium]|nr:hypothetical protein [Actinomycetota bacterium]